MLEARPLLWDIAGTRSLLGLHLLERLTRCYMDGIILGIGLPAVDDAIAIERIKLAEIAAPPGLMGSNEGGARAAKEIENDMTTLRDIFDGISDHRYGLDRGMKGQVLVPAAAKGVHALVGPNIGAVTPMLAKLKAVDVRGSPFLEGKDQLML